jgi:hypothetical protein
MDHELPDTGSAEGSDGKARGDGPHEVHGKPAPAVCANLVSTHESQTKHDERERRSVVQPGLSGETEANRLGVVFVRDLHVRSQDRIRRREQRTEQRRRSDRQSKSRWGLPLFAAVGIKE